MNSRILACVWLLAATQASAASALQQQAIHKEYEDGDFDIVINKLESFQKAHPTYSRSDSVFIARHLAVVYAANPLTIEKGKHWMYVLLKLMPAADLVGMYVNEEIDRVFEKVRGEFLLRQKSFGVDSSRMVLPERPGGARTASAAAARDGDPDGSRPTSTSHTSLWKRPAFWLLGGLTAATVGTVTVLYLAQSDDKEPLPEKELVVPNDAGQ